MQPSSEIHPPDKIIGILILIFTLTCGSALLLLILGFTAPPPGRGFETSMLMVWLPMLLVFALGIAAGWGIMQSRRWGFIVGSIIYSIAAMLYFPELWFSILAFGSFEVIGSPPVVLNVGLAIYCILRLTGKLGPRPL